MAMSVVSFRAYHSKGNAEANQQIKFSGHAIRLLDLKREILERNHKQGSQDFDYKVFDAQSNKGGMINGNGSPSSTFSYLILIAFSLLFLFYSFLWISLHFSVLIHEKNFFLDQFFIFVSFRICWWWRVCAKELDCNLQEDSREGFSNVSGRQVEWEQNASHGEVNSYMCAIAAAAASVSGACYSSWISPDILWGSLRRAKRSNTCYFYYYLLLRHLLLLLFLLPS